VPDSVDGLDVAALERTLDEHMVTIAPLAVTLRNDPRGTIRPERAELDSAGRRALAELAIGADKPGATTGSALLLEEVLGVGGMGIVRLAEQVALGRKVAVKSLRPEQTSEAAKVSLLREAWATASLEHPNVLPVYDMGLDADGRPLIVLRRIGGVDWGGLLGEPEEVKRRFGAEDLLEWNLGVLLQVCDAVRYAHSRGIVHRDLKPDNVMVGSFGEVYVLDWGLAVSVRDDTSGRLQLASRVDGLSGTPCYMAPEMLPNASGGVTERTDVYLLGAILHEIATGAPPHEGPDMRAILRSILRSRPALEDVPPELAQICRRAMHPDPAERFEDVGQLRTALQGFLKHRGSAKLVEGADRRAAELRDAIARGARDEELYDLLGECRFGYRAALEAWPDNADARVGLGRAIASMIEWELASGDPRAATTLLAGLPDPAPALAAKVEQARQDKERERERIAALEAMGRDRDVRTGQQVRSGVTFTLGIGWTIAPLVQGAMVARDPEYEEYGAKLVVFPALFLAVGLVIAVLGRRVFLATALNRTVIWGTLFAAAAPLLMALGGFMGGVPARTAIWFLPFLWFCVATLVSLTVEKRLWPCAAGYLVSFFAAAAWPEHLYPILAAANAVFSLTVWNAWRALPRTSV